MTRTCTLSDEDSTRTGLVLVFGDLDLNTGDMTTTLPYCSRYTYMTLCLPFVMVIHVKCVEQDVTTLTLIK